MVKSERGYLADEGVFCLCLLYLEVSFAGTSRRSFLCFLKYAVMRHGIFLLPHVLIYFASLVVIVTQHTEVKNSDCQCK